MIEKVSLAEALASMQAATSLDNLVGLSGSNLRLMSPGNLQHPDRGCETIKGIMEEGKWYRIAVGLTGVNPSSGIFNLANIYTNTAPRQVLFSVFSAGYASTPYVTKLSGSESLPISKVRLLFKSDSESESFLDVYDKIYLANRFTISASCLIGYKLQNPIEVSETPDAGYTVKEFELG